MLGGTGFLGAKTVAALRQLPQARVEVASRRGPLVVDVTRSETFRALALARADVIVDLTDGPRSRPDALAAFCLERGLTLLEATSDAETVRRLVTAHRGSPGPGRVVLGAGIFTGVSNLLARAVADEAGPGAALTWAVTSSPFSGAGNGTISLMVDAAARPVVRTIDGARFEGRLSKGPTLDFGGSRRPSLRMSLAEAEMLPLSASARAVDTCFAPRPGLLVVAFTALPSFLLRAAWFRAALEASFTVLRRYALRGVASPVQMLARAERDGRVFERHTTSSDGMEAAAFAIAALAEGVAQASPPPGLRFIDEVLRFEPVVKRVNALAGWALYEVVDPAVGHGQPR
ncbi:MAG: hypothetical protein INH41_08885 [Myxococcaceae bacterium]|nr:hypothetical protein [Myxococcaceae bacterium]MCA3012499.1 hypothetical protein [Myxococcaceae bacterium]